MFTASGNGKDDWGIKETFFCFIDGTTLNPIYSSLHSLNEGLWRNPKPPEIVEAISPSKGASKIFLALFHLQFKTSGFCNCQHQYGTVVS